MMVGLDIGSYSLKAVELSKKGEEFLVETVASAYNPVGHFLPQDEKQFEMLATAVKNMLVENKLTGKKVAVSIPENQVFSSIVEMPWLSDAELSSAIQWEAEQHLPVSLATVNLEYSVISRPENQNQGKMKVLLVAAKKDMVERLTLASDFMEVELLVVEPAMLALGRSFVHDIGDQNQASVMLCNFGALSTDMMIVNGDQPAFMHSIPTGGLALTRAVERGLSMQPSQAEEYKRSYGMSKQHLEGKVAGSLVGVFNSILSEIRKSIQFYQSESGGHIQKVVMYGGGSYLPDLTPYISETLGLEAVVANPFEKIGRSDALRLPKEVASFGVAVGLAMREED